MYQFSFYLIFEEIHYDIMETITLKIDTRTKRGKIFLQFLEQFLKDDSAVEIIRVPNETTIKALQEAKEGKVIRAENVKELMKKLNS